MVFTLIGAFNSKVAVSYPSRIYFSRLFWDSVKRFSVRTGKTPVLLISFNSTNTQVQINTCEFGFDPISNVQYPRRNYFCFFESQRMDFYIGLQIPVLKSKKVIFLWKTSRIDIGVSYLEFLDLDSVDKVLLIQQSLSLIHKGVFASGT